MIKKILDKTDTNGKVLYIHVDFSSDVVYDVVCKVWAYDTMREILYENNCLLHLSGYYCSKHHLSKPMISKNSSQVLHFISTNQLIWFYFINQNPLCFGIPLLLDSCTRVFKLHRLSAGVPLFSFHSFSSAEKKILCWLPFQCRDIGLHFPFVSWSIAERNGRNND